MLCRPVGCSASLGRVSLPSRAGARIAARRAGAGAERSLLTRQGASAAARPDVVLR